MLSAIAVIPGFAQFNGEADSTFGTNGLIEHDINNSGNSQRVTDSKVGPDGKLYIAGYQVSNGQWDMFVSRFNFDGTIDASFGGNGTTIIDPLIGAKDVVNAMDITTDGKIVLAGYVEGISKDYVIVRLTQDGIPDTSYNGNGYLIIGGNSADEVWTDVVAEPDGRIIAAGYTYENQQSDYVFVRTESDGSPVTTFGTNGVAIFDFAGTDEIRSIVRTAPNRFYAAGKSGGQPEVISISGTGNLVNNWGNAGRASINFDANAIESIRKIKSGDNGVIYVGGSANKNSNNSSFFCKLLSDGTPDTTFGGDGYYLVDMANGSNDFIMDFEIQSNNDVLATGTRNDGSKMSFWTTMITYNGIVNTSYGNNGVYSYDVGGIADYAMFARDENNDMYVVGSRQVNLSGDIAMVKLKTTTPTVGINDRDFTIDQMNLYPNPTNGLAYLELNMKEQSEVQISILNLSGQVMSQEIDRDLSAGQHRIELTQSIEQLPQGMYLVQVMTNDQYRILKILKD